MRWDWRSTWRVIEERQNPGIEVILSRYLLKNYQQSVRPKSEPTYQISILASNLPNLRRETFNQGHEIRKASSNFSKCWFLKRLGATRQRDGRFSILVSYKVCSDSLYNLVDCPAPVCHLESVKGAVKWSTGQILGLFGSSKHTRFQRFKFRFQPQSCVENLLRFNIEYPGDTYDTVH